MDRRHNPRRAYDAHGRMIQPMTVADHLAAGRRLVELWCHACHHHGTVSVDGFDPATPIPDIGLRHVCSKCGGRDIASRPDVDEFYESMRRLRR